LATAPKLVWPDFGTMKKVLIATPIAEAATGLALIFPPLLVVG
jgi:hypothetical protein